MPTTSTAGTTAGPRFPTADDSIEAWPTERTMVVAATAQTAGPSTAAEESSDEIWVSEETMPRWQEPGPVVEDDFLSEISPAPAVVAVAVPVTAAPSGHRRLIAAATAAALGAVAIVSTLGLAGMVWPATSPEASSPQTIPVLRDSKPTPAEAMVSLTREASVASPATPAVQATSGAGLVVAPVTSASEGQLRVTSAPSGARVTVNGIGWGQTPLTIEHLPPGMKTVRVTMEGYVSQERQVDLRRDRPAGTLHVTLTSDTGD